MVGNGSIKFSIIKNKGRGGRAGGAGGGKQGTGRRLCPASVLYENIIKLSG